MYTSLGNASHGIRGRPLVKSGELPMWSLGNTPRPEVSWKPRALQPVEHYSTKYGQWYWCQGTMALLTKVYKEL